MEAGCRWRCLGNHVKTKEEYVHASEGIEDLLQNEINKMGNKNVRLAAETSTM